MYAHIVNGRQFALCATAFVCLFIAGAFGQPTCSNTLKPAPVEMRDKMADGLTYKDDAVLMCSAGSCGKLALNDINTAYPGTFSKEDAAVKDMGLPYNAYTGELTPVLCANQLASSASLESRRCGKFWSDRDQCCPTWRYITIYRGPLRNIFGRTCYIIQLPILNLYQYISVGRCGFPQSCRGRCTQQYTIQSMLAYCPGQPGIRMHHFRIPTYCSCQNVRG